MSCKDCNVNLTELNQFPSDRKNKAYYCIECRNKRNSKWQKEHREQRNLQRRNKTKLGLIDYDKQNKQAKKYRQKIKMEVLSHYSGTHPPQCANPYGIHDKPFTILEALELDHIKGNGSQERKTLSFQWKSKQDVGGYRIYLWLRKRGYPKDYQVLCANCNTIKRIKNREFG